MKFSPGGLSLLMCGTVPPPTATLLMELLSISLQLIVANRPISIPGSGEGMVTVTPHSAPESM